MKITAFGYFVFAACCTQTLPAATVGFDTPGDLQNNFNFATSSGINRYTQSSSGGVGSSGSVGFTVVSREDTTAIYNQSSFDFSTLNAQLSISEFFHVVPLTSSSSGSGQYGFTTLEVGFSTQNSTGFGHHISGNEFMSVGLSPNATTGDSFYMFETTGYPSGGSVSAVWSSPQYIFNLTAGNWYKLTGTFRNTGPSTYSVSGAVDNYGADGLTPSGNVFAFNNYAVLVTTALASDTAIWGGFLADSANGTDHLDMFTIQQVPEPSTCALLGLGAAALALYRRRK
jgi:hypothetical protein